MSRRNKFGIDMSKYTEISDLTQGQEIQELTEKLTKENSDQVVSLPIDKIQDMPGNDFLFPYDDTVIDRISEEIKANGFHSPIIVVSGDNDTYTCISGHQRKRAMAKLGNADIPCIVLSNLSEQAARDLWRAENSLHRDPTSLSRARLVESYCKDYEKYGMGGGKRKYAAGKAGVSEGQAANLLNILTFPEEIQEMCQDNKFPYTALSNARDFTDEQKDLLVIKLQNFQKKNESVPSNADVRKMIEQIRKDTSEQKYGGNENLENYDVDDSADIQALDEKRKKEFKSYYKKNFVTDPNKTSVIDQDLQKATDSIYSLLNGGMFIAGNNMDVERSLYGLEKIVSMLKKNLKRKQ